MHKIKIQSTLNGSENTIETTAIFLFDSTTIDECELI